ncbi:unnamed protein product, partial [Prorocentrum cordatum]
GMAVTGVLGESAESRRRHDADAKGGARLAARHWVVALVFFSRVSQTVLRMAMGALVIPLCEDMRCGAGAKGWLLSAHAAGYCSTQVLGGCLADRLGGKERGLVGAGSLGPRGGGDACCCVGLRARRHRRLPGRHGSDHGPALPRKHPAARAVAPRRGERAVASTALDSGITLGSLIVVPLSGVLAVWIGWRSTFTVYGLGMLAYALVWAWLAADSPAGCAYCSAEERSFLERALPKKDGQKELDTPSGKWRFLDCVTYARLWAIYGSHFTFNYAVYFVNSWSATYYLETFGLRPEQAGLHLSMPHVANSLVKVLVNPALERWMKGWGADTLKCRRTFSVLGFVGLALFLGLVPACASPAGATLFFSVAFGFLALHPSGFKANYMDVTTSRGGLVSGIGNTVGSAGSTVGPLVVAHLRDATGGWAAAFQSVALLNVASAVLFLTMSSTVPIEAPSRSPEGAKKRE